MFLTKRSDSPRPFPCPTCHPTAAHLAFCTCPLQALCTTTVARLRRSSSLKPRSARAASALRASDCKQTAAARVRRKSRRATAARRTDCRDVALRERLEASLLSGGGSGS